MPSITLAHKLRPRITAALLGMPLLAGLFAAAALALQPSVVQADTGDVPCNRIHKALTTGTRYERNKLPAAIKHPPQTVVDQCTETLMKAFLDPLRSKLWAPSKAAQELEQQWLTELVSRMPADRAGPWIAQLEIETLPLNVLRPLLRRWAGEGTSATETVVEILAERDDRRLSNEILHSLYSQFVEFEGRSVTGATFVKSSLEKLGFLSLFENPRTGVFWSHGNAYDYPELRNAELFMLKNEHLEAFRQYAAAVTQEASLLALTGLYGEAFLLSRGTLKDFRDMSLPYRHCRNGVYEAQWGFGPLHKAAEKLPAGELRAEYRTRRERPACDTLSLDDVDKMTEAIEKAPVETLTSRSALRRRMVVLEKMVEHADALTKSGRLIQANEIRETVWSEVRRADLFRYLGGATAARRLQKLVRDWLPFPPKPKVREQILNSSQ